MDRNEDDGLLLLAPLRDAEPDIRTGVDIDKAKRVGRRTVKNRMIASVAAVVSLVVLAGVAVNAIGSMPESVAPAKGPFDVFRQVITVGTAGGFTPDSYESRPDMQIVTLRRTDDGPGTVRVEVVREDRAVSTETAEEAGIVYGLPAHWIGTQRTTLQWRLANGVVAQASSDVQLPDIQNKLHKVAEAVQPADRPLSMPFTLPRDDSVELVSMWVKAATAESLLTFKHNGPTGRATVEVGLKPNDSNLLKNHTSYNGSQLVVSDPAAGNSSAVLLDVAPGLMAFAHSTDWAPEPQVVNMLASELKPAPNLADRSTWPTTVWR
nr:hypothetical protein [Kibdelosporangium sp. MJ126-NF4]CEL19514.1 hypothetical protein [Kibdelosporangium sp. MJ126-NF4]CTQ94686.1 hypothetical protein [Kibdelosporangium sp. MJ126-NF4]